MEQFLDRIRPGSSDMQEFRDNIKQEENMCHTYLGTPERKEKELHIQGLEDKLEMEL